MAKPGWHEEVLKFWFEELTPEDWFTSKPETDALVRERFGDLHNALKAAPPPEVETDPRAALAAVILFDQFPRNIFRSQPDAFSSDDLALHIARKALDKRFDHDMTNVEKQFLYMPFQHSEVSADQERSVDLFKSLGNEEALKYAIEHREIIDRFGRFPHRNRVLGRTTTEAEAAFMEGHEGYGQ
jgi:uncharacterized protein (DUF924 family)